MEVQEDIHLLPNTSTSLPNYMVSLPRDCKLNTQCL